jgi:rod shape-determining protein MreB
MGKMDWTDKKHMVVDFGTASTRVYIEGKGIVFNEASVIAVNTKTKKIVAIGEDAKKCLGKQSKYIRVHTLQSNGVIVDIRMFVLFLGEVFKKYTEIIKSTYVTLACPPGLTPVEKTALIKSIESLGCFFVDPQDASKLGLYGTGVDITKPDGRLVLDMGAGKVTCGMVSSNEVVVQKSLKIGGNYLDNEIMKTLKADLKIAVGEVTAEKVKNAVATALKTKKGLSVKIYGYDVTSMMPTDKDVTEDDLQEVMKKAIYQITSLVTTVLEESPSELSEDIIKNGIVVVGNFAKLNGLKVYMEDFFEVPITIAKNCGTAVLDGGIKYRDLSREEYEFKMKKIKETEY